MRMAGQIIVWLPNDGRVAEGFNARSSIEVLGKRPFRTRYGNDLNQSRVCSKMDTNYGWTKQLSTRPTFGVLEKL
eukprot:scaffold2505_cov157-Skeletonema_menzelii.AAC.8